TSASSASSRRSSGRCSSSSPSRAFSLNARGSSTTRARWCRRSGSRAFRSSSYSCSRTSGRRWSTQPHSPRSSSLPACAGSTAATLSVAGGRWAPSGVLGAVALFVVTPVLWIAPAGGFHILKPYQVDRLTAFFPPNSDPADATYNIVQSKNAIGAGQFHGRGPNGATQTTLHFLPEHHTDFVFAS